MFVQQNILILLKITNNKTQQIIFPRNNFIPKRTDIIGIIENLKFKMKKNIKRNFSNESK
jgi:hypothetical protein